MTGLVSLCGRVVRHCTARNVSGTACPISSSGPDLRRLGPFIPLSKMPVVAKALYKGRQRPMAPLKEHISEGIVRM